MALSRKAIGHDGSIVAGGDIKAPISIHHAVVEASSSPSSTEVSIRPPYGRMPLRMRGRHTLVDEVLRAMKTVVRQVNSGSPTEAPIWLLHGLGGVGKSAVALTVVAKAEQAGVQVFWVDGSDRSRLHAGMSRVAQRLASSDQRMSLDVSQPGLVDQVWETLEQATSDWLLVIDNADDPNVLAADGQPTVSGNGWLRVSKRGMVLVTSRVGERAVWGRHIEPRAIGMLSSVESARVLLDTAEYDERARRDNRDEAKRLAERLGGLPLALRAGGRYLALAAGRVSLAEYGALLESRFESVIDAGTRAASLLDGGGPDPRDLVMATWDLSLDWLSEQGMPEARGLLELLSCFGTAPVPYGLLEEALDGSNTLAYGRLHELVTALRALALVYEVQRPGPAGRTPHKAGATNAVSTHPLVSEVMRAALAADPQRAKEMRENVAEILIRSSAGADDQNGVPAPLSLAIEPHLRHMAALLTANPHGVSPATQKRFAQAVTKLAISLSSAMSYEAAVECLSTYWTLASGVLGEENKLVRKVRHERGHMLWKLERFEAALLDLAPTSPLLFRAFMQVFPDAAISVIATACGLRAPNNAAREQVFIMNSMLKITKWNPMAWSRRGARSTRKLAALLQEYGHYAEAERVYRFVLGIRRRRLGPQHTLTLGTWASVADVLQLQRKYAEAETEYRALIEVEERARGASSRQALVSRSGLAMVLDLQGKAQEAEQEYRSTSAAMDECLGDQDGTALAARTNLAVMLRNRGRLRESEAEYRAILKRQRRALEPNDLDVVATRLGLARTLRDQGRYLDAEAEFRAARAIRSQVLGPDHHDTLSISHNLAHMVADRGEPEAGLQISQEIVSVLKRSRPDSLETLRMRVCLARKYRSMDRFDEAAAEFRTAIDAALASTSPESEWVLAARHEMARTMLAQEQLGEAETEFRRLVEIRHKLSGGNDLAIIPTRLDLAQALEAQGKTVAALDQYTEVLKIERVLGDDNRLVRVIRALMARTKGRHAEAAEQFAAVLEETLKTAGPDHPATLADSVALAKALSASGDTRRCVEILREVLEVQTRMLGPRHMNTIKTQRVLDAELAKQEGTASER